MRMRSRITGAISRRRCVTYKLSEAIATGNREAASFYVRQHIERVQKDMLTAFY